ncbi:probable methyltransferase-like protein 24 [Ruditapes philippinarum]|uniref:probable methyltransferase-like protein 24 n=1 Tax=Ruditapes philippinarum TaxID=129788 RepID=UPI00295B9AB2|nr:probable methyltransferase-like protein 24 [Ruditapes philippinarum]
MTSLFNLQVDAPSLRQFDNGKVFLPADDVKLKDMTTVEMVDMFWKYINTLQVLCRNQTRVGSLKDGGKEVCIDEQYKPRVPCLVYSFGQVSNFQFDFEMDIVKKFGCEVHTFDPSREITSKVKIPSEINYHLVGLYDSNTIIKDGWKVNNLSNIRKELHHERRVVDILKIDVEGAEWQALPAMFKSGVLKYVKQICIEIHFGQCKPGGKIFGGVSIQHQLSTLRQLYLHGFHIFIHEHNLKALDKLRFNYEGITSVNEISLINVKWNINGD